MSLFVRQRLTMVVAKQRSSDLDRLAALIERGDVTCSVDRTYFLDQVSEAIRHLIAGDTRGKAVIAV